MRREPIRRIGVVIPACDEESAIGRALAAVSIASAHVPRVPVDVVVVANGCVDATAAVAQAHGVHVLVVDSANVGAARAAGVRWALRHGSDGLWLATTDADSRVPPGWLAAQVESAAGGADVFLGTVELSTSDMHRHRHWAAHYAAGIIDDRRHRHVHGASLGVRATSYAGVGGFRPLAAHEDADLVVRLVAAGAVIAMVSDVPVETSARHDPRAPAGVGADLAASAPPRASRACPRRTFARGRGRDGVDLAAS